MKVGDPGKPSIEIATASVDSTGQFTLQADPNAGGQLTAALAKARKDNSGWLNFDLVGIGNGKMVYESGPARVRGRPVAGPGRLERDRSWPRRR